MSKVTLKPFTEGDWSAFAGCEGENPQIGGITVRMVGQNRRGKNVDGVIIADETSVQIHLIDEEDDKEYSITRYTLDQEESNGIAVMMDEYVSVNDLLNTGFNIY